MVKVTRDFQIVFHFWKRFWTIKIVTLWELLDLKQSKFGDVSVEHRVTLYHSLMTAMLYFKCTVQLIKYHKKIKTKSSLKHSKDAWETNQGTMKKQYVTDPLFVWETLCEVFEFIIWGNIDCSSFDVRANSKNRASSFGLDMI